MNALLIYPEIPETFFSFHHALPFISRRAALPPIGLITISAMFPPEWSKRLVDMNIRELDDKDIEWADIAFISAMYIQKEPVKDLFVRLHKRRIKIVCGGPLFLHEFDNFHEADHFIIGEAESVFNEFISDFTHSRPLKRIYRADHYADISTSPVPDFDLLDVDFYAYMNLQISRGCPYHCDFCEIPSYLGNKVRMKRGAQVVKELQALHDIGWRGNVFIVDDNFIGNRHALKNDILPVMTSWMRRNSYPFRFYVQTSIDLADYDDLIQMMTDSGINSTFIGIETPSEASLEIAGKNQNKNRDLKKDVIKLMRSGLQVSGGFIVGFDTDNLDVFKAQANFINDSGIVWAMAGLLNAPKGTALYERLDREGRLNKEATGSNTDFTMNFTPAMNQDTLMNEYRNLLSNIYSFKPYYRRIRRLLTYYKPRSHPVKFSDVNMALVLARTILRMGIAGKQRLEFWKLIIWTLFNRPGLLSEAIIYIFTGYHFRKVYRIEN